MRRLRSSMSSRVHSKISLNLPMRLPIGRTSGARCFSSRQAFCCQPRAAHQIPTSHHISSEGGFLTQTRIHYSVTLTASFTTTECLNAIFQPKPTTILANPHYSRPPPVYPSSLPRDYKRLETTETAMDSMRTLNTSLPRSPRRKRANQPPEQLIQSFKSAALSVTNLYKTAAADQTRSRDAGYQDALDDLLTFLDQQHLGLGDGEGWKVRQWATERLDGSPPAHMGSDSDDDRGETTKRARSSSPTAQRSTVPEGEQARQPSRSTSPVRAASVPMAPPATSQPQNNLFHAPEVFSFRSAHPYPYDVDMQAADTTSNTIPQPDPLPSPAVRVDVVSRGSRTPHRGGNHQNRHGARSTAGAKSLGSVAGSKRRITFGDYFDLGSLGDGKDGRDGGGKRGRFT